MDGLIFPETEGFTNYICRKCYQQSETIDHIRSGCKILTATGCTPRHSGAVKVIH